MSQTYGGPMGIASLLTGLLGDWAQYDTGRGIWQDFMNMRGQSLGKVDDLTGRTNDALTGLIRGTNADPGLDSRYQALYTVAAANAPELAKNLGKGYTDLASSLPAEYRSLSMDLGDRFGTRTDTLGSDADIFSKDLAGRYADRTAKGMSMLEGYGNQAKADVRQGFADRTKSELARLGGVGLGNTSAGSVMSRGMGEEESNAMNRLNEDLMGVNYNAYSGLTGDELLARGKLGEMSLGLKERTTRDALLAKERGLDTYTGLKGDLSTNALNANSDLAQWGFLTGNAMNEANLDKQLELGMMPISNDISMTSMWNNTAMNWGQPPEVLNPFSGTANRLSSLAAAQMMKPKPEEKGFFSKLMNPAVGGAAGMGIGALAFPLEPMYGAALGGMMGGVGTGAAGSFF